MEETPEFQSQLYTWACTSTEAQKGKSFTFLYPCKAVKLIVLKPEIKQLFFHDSVSQNKKYTWNISHKCQSKMVLSRKKPVEHHFTWKTGWMTFFQLVRRGYLADIFSKINEVSLSLPEKQPTILAANDKMQVFKQKSDTWKKFLLPQCGNTPVLSGFCDTSIESFLWRRR